MLHSAKQSQLEKASEQSHVLTLRDIKALSQKESERKDLGADK